MTDKLDPLWRVYASVEMPNKRHVLNEPTWWEWHDGNPERTQEFGSGDPAFITWHFGAWDSAQDDGSWPEGYPAERMIVHDHPRNDPEAIAIIEAAIAKAAETAKPKKRRQQTK